jgi:predicted glycosyltransferase involved in capsule biosynthesis
MQNNSITKFTFVIPFRYRIDRIIPLRRVIEWLNGFNGTNILLIEQDTHSKIDQLSFKCDHHFVESSLPFNKSWAYNIAIKRVTSPYIIFLDADFIMDPQQLIDCLNVVDSYDCLVPTKTITNLSPMESNMDTRTILSIKRPEEKKTIMDHIVIFKRDSLLRIGGWNEDFFGGNDDNEFQEMKVKKMLNWKQMDFDGSHISHGFSGWDKSLLSRNEELMKFIKTQPDSFYPQHVQLVLPKIGYQNRFQL